MNDIVSSSTRCSHIHSFSTSTPTNLLTELNGGGANLIWINPDNSHNMHDNSISSGDTYMSTLIPQILGSTEFTTTKAALLVTFDEGNNSYPSDYVYTILAGPATKPAYKSTALYDHYSLLATLEKNWVTVAWNLSISMTKGFGSDGFGCSIVTMNSPSFSSLISR